MNPKDLLFVGVLLFVTLNLSAQTLSPRFGIKAGLSLSYATVNDARGTDSKTGFHIGARLNTRYRRGFLFNQVCFSQRKGRKYTSSTVATTYPHRQTTRIRLMNRI